MTIKDFITKNYRRYQTQGAIQAATSMAREIRGKVVFNPYLRVRQHALRQTVPHQADSLESLQSTDSWLLLVFDAGRYDYMAPLLEDQFQTDAQPQYSAARDTFEWISTQWVDGVDDVTYITAMTPIASEYPDFDAEGFNSLYHTDAFTDSMREIVEVWDDHWDTGIAQVPPEATVDVAREYLDRKKLVVHFSQPHSPFIGTPRLLGHTSGPSARPQSGAPNDEPIWDRVQSGRISDHYLRMAYQGNAARAVRAAAELVAERDGGRVVATADHGEALGEFGMYTHDRAPHPKRRLVPWAEIKGVRESPEGNQSGGSSRAEQLDALGYR